MNVTRLATIIAAYFSALLTFAFAQAAAQEITGVVRDPAGEPVAGARVAIHDLLRGDVTDREGRFRLSLVPPGKHTVSVTARGLASVNKEVSAPESGLKNIVIKLGPNEALARAAALYGAPPAEHLEQKRAYLNALSPATKRKPNIVLIFFDDLGYGDLSSYGNELIETPNIDALAARGMKLTEFYSASPVCTPSRAALLTGRYPTRSLSAKHVFVPSDHLIAKIRLAAGLPNAIPADEILLPEILSRAGYRTGAFGKWHLGDMAGHLPTDLGFQTFFGVHFSSDMMPLALYRGVEIDTPPGEVDRRILTERFADEAIAFIRENADGPFFAYVPFTAPHLPHNPHPDRTGVSEGGAYGDVIEDLDFHVGRIVDALGELELSDDTIVIVTSDNGADQLGSASPLRGFKGGTHEGGVRVPAFIVWPDKVKPGSVSDEMAMTIDLFPTILSALGLPLPQDRVIDGRDLSGLLGGGVTPHDYLYYLTAFSGEYQAVRNAGFKYREVFSEKWHLAPTGTPAPHGARTSLYRMDVNNESHDLTLKHPDEAEMLEETLKAFRAAHEENPRGWLSPEAEQ